MGVWKQQWQPVAKASSCASLLNNDIASSVQLFSRSPRRSNLHDQRCLLNRIRSGGGVGWPFCRRDSGRIRVATEAIPNRSVTMVTLMVPGAVLPGNSGPPICSRFIFARRLLFFPATRATRWMELSDSGRVQVRNWDATCFLVSASGAARFECYETGDVHRALSHF